MYSSPLSRLPTPPKKEKEKQKDFGGGSAQGPLLVVIRALSRSRNQGLRQELPAAKHGLTPFKLAFPVITPCREEGSVGGSVGGTVAEPHQQCSGATSWLCAQGSPLTVLRNQNGVSHRRGKHFDPCTISPDPLSNF